MTPRCPRPHKCFPGAGWLFIPPRKAIYCLLYMCYLIPAACSLQIKADSPGTVLALFPASVVGRLAWGGKWGWGTSLGTPWGNARLWGISQPQRGGQSTSAPSAARQDELGGNREGDGAGGCPTTPPPPSPRMGGISPSTRSIPPPTPFPRFCPRAPTSHGPSATCWGHPTCPASTHGCPGVSAPPPTRPGVTWGAGGQVEGSLEPLLMPNEINTTKQHMVPHHTRAPTSGSGEGNAPPTHTHTQFSLLGGVTPGFGGSSGTHCAAAVQVHVPPHLSPQLHPTFSSTEDLSTAQRHGPPSPA